MESISSDIRHRAGGAGYLLAVAWWVLSVADSLQADEYRAPELETAIPWKAIGVIAACLAGLALSILKNPRRSTQDVDD
jgi:hypothetical protein